MEPNSAPVIIGSDHAAFALKETLKHYVEQKNIAVTDVGPHSADAVDYPDYAFLVAGAVSSGKYERGILLCSTGLGMSMAANKFPHIRAALCNDLFSAIMSRRHNNANILVMGGRVIGDVLAKEIVSAWMETPFEGGRHQRRIDKFDDMGCPLNGLNII